MQDIGVIANVNMFISNMHKIIIVISSAIIIITLSIDKCKKILKVSCKNFTLNVSPNYKITIKV